MVDSEWRPTATHEVLVARARIIDAIRQFFRDREVLEVETPYLAHATVTDPHLHSFSASTPSGESEELYLQTSPEYAMKRLLCAGAGPIFQIARCFRAQERGSRHNPEFTLLEWYRPGFDHHQLMAEVADLVSELLAERLGSSIPVHKLTFSEAFEPLGFDPHTASVETMRAAVAERWPDGVEVNDRDEALSLLLTHVVEPRFETGAITFLHDFPASQAALARLRRETQPDGTHYAVAERFEAYVVVADDESAAKTEGGVQVYELANGFHELRDPKEQRERFEADLTWRRKRGLEQPAIDTRLLAALESGLPRCSGVALGVDRLVMLALGETSISSVLAFPIERA